MVKKLSVVWMVLTVLVSIFSCSQVSEELLPVVDSDPTETKTRSGDSFLLYLLSESHDADLRIGQVGIGGRHGYKVISGADITNPMFGGGSSGYTTILEIPGIAPSDIQYLQFQFINVREGVYQFYSGNHFITNSTVGYGYKNLYVRFPVELVPFQDGWNIADFYFFIHRLPEIELLDWKTIQAMRSNDKFTVTYPGMRTSAVTVPGWSGTTLRGRLANELPEGVRYPQVIFSPEFDPEESYLSSIAYTFSLYAENTIQATLLESLDFADMNLGHFKVDYSAVTGKMKLLIEEEIIFDDEYGSPGYELTNQEIYETNRNYIQDIKLMVANGSFIVFVGNEVVYEFKSIVQPDDHLNYKFYVPANLHLFNMKVTM